VGAFGVVVPSPPMNRILVVVPTRNRAQLARAAIASVIRQRVASHLLVSDNSTEPSESEDLHRVCAALDPALVTYVRPGEPLAMTAHWEWALQRGLELGDFTHITYLTDRMIFRDHALAEIAQMAGLHPRDVISYNHDRIDDSRRPVVLEQRDWTGKLFAIPSVQLLRLTARAIIPPCLPRMLNAIVPVDVLADVRRRFGTVFGSVSPDYAFAYRVLSLRDRILYYDTPALIHYALDRSNGATYSRGIASRDRVDFMANIGSAVLNGAAPVPAFHNATNGIFSEYEVARASAEPGRFPPINRFQYLGMMDWDSRQLVDPGLAAASAALLRANGWRRRDRLAWLLPRLAGYLRADPIGALSAALRRPRRFPTAEAAIEHANRHPRAARPNARHFYLWFLLEAPGVVREAATTPDVPLSRAA
jgi:hypothetical protein